MKSLHYPNRNADPAEVFSQKTLDAATAYLMSWRQSAGGFGDMHLHACWGDSSALTRRYHGKTVATTWFLLQGMTRLFDRTGDGRWRCQAEDIVAEVLHLQLPEGGFYHASSEYEPTYTCQQSCPIHQGLPLLTLLDYAAWGEATEHRKSLVRPALDAHWEWFRKYWWKRGSDERGRPLDLPGFCGVTNQDLVIVAVLARYGQVFGDWSRYEEYGKPTLEAYLSPAYYHKALGLFERGPDGDFVERTAYYDIIVLMLEIIQKAVPGAALMPVVDNVCRHLFDALHVGKDGMTHVSWGAELDYAGGPKVKRWIRHPYTVSGYPGLLEAMEGYLKRHPDAALQAGYDALEKTLAAYVFADGVIPVALGGEPLFSVVGKATTFWGYLVKRLGDGIRNPQRIVPPRVRRRFKGLTWTSDARQWSIEKDGSRVFAGLKSNPSAIVAGPDETLANVDFARLAQAEPDAVEEMTWD